MFRFRLLPWEYGVRNLLRRPARTALTVAALGTVVLLIFIVVGFIRGLESSLSASGDPNVVLVYSVGAGENIENSAIPARTASLLAASLNGVRRRYSETYVSPELYVGTRVATVKDRPPMPGIVRGVTTSAPLLRRTVQLVEGHWPGPGEVLVGSLVSTKLGCDPRDLEIGKEVAFENRRWKISGSFAADGSAFESELWCPLEELQQATKRQDLSLIAVGLSSDSKPVEIELFCKERVDLELQAKQETAYYASLQAHYRPVRMLAWLIVGLVASAGIFAGLNTMYGAVVGRVRELAMLQTVGFRRRSIVISLIQEALLLSIAASLMAGVFALLVINGAAVRFTMGAFVLRVDGVAVLVGCGVGVLLGVVGAIPPAIKAMRISIVEGLKAV
jgi:putative ABC transport system permease protein